MSAAFSSCAGNAVGLQNIDRDAHKATLASISADVAGREFGFALNRRVSNRGSQRPDRYAANASA
jgi:hypothetical protein